MTRFPLHNQPPRAAQGGSERGGSSGTTAFPFRPQPHTHPGSRPLSTTPGARERPLDVPFFRGGASDRRRLADSEEAGSPYSCVRAFASAGAGASGARGEEGVRRFAEARGTTTTVPALTAAATFCSQWRTARPKQTARSSQPVNARWLANSVFALWLAAAARGALPQQGLRACCLPRPWPVVGPACPPPPKPVLPLTPARHSNQAHKTARLESQKRQPARDCSHQGFCFRTS